MKRYEALKILAKHVKDDLAMVSLGGMIDEWWSLRPNSTQSFFNKGMGTVVGCAYGLAAALPHRRVVAIDGDGSFLMSLGMLPVMGSIPLNNLVVIVLDNESHEVVGGVPSHTANGTDLSSMAKGAGVGQAATVRNENELEEVLSQAFSDNQQYFIVIKVEQGTIRFPEDERKRTDGKEDKYHFVRHIEDLEGTIIIPRELVSIRPIDGDVTWDDVTLFKNLKLKDN